MYNVNNDLNKLLGINLNMLSAITAATTMDIAQSITDMIYAGQEVEQIDLGYGILKISYIDKKVSFKFIPSKALAAGIGNTDLVLDATSKAFVENANKYYKNYLFD